MVIGASVGIAIGDPGRCTADSLVRDADLALYAAKDAGRGKHCFFEPAMHTEASDRQVLENDLRQAIDKGELWVAYQPIVRTAGEEVCGFEALVRWDHPLRGRISPDKFIPLAEECGLIPRLGAWVLETALDEAAHWPDQVRIAVNLSPIQFNDPSIVDIVPNALARSGVRADRLELEITEGVFLAEGDTTDETFSKLKDPRRPACARRLRHRLFSSLGYLKKAPFDKIKIDQSFVRGAASKTSRNSAIIRAIVTLAESLQMDTCAEGVETHDDLNLIRELGCSQIQGYIFGKPLPSEDGARAGGQATAIPDGYQSHARAPPAPHAQGDGFDRRQRLRSPPAQYQRDGRAGRMLDAGRAGNPRRDGYRRRRPDRRDRSLGIGRQVRAPVHRHLRDVATGSEEAKAQRRPDAVTLVRRSRKPLPRTPLPAVSSSPLRQLRPACDRSWPSAARARRRSGR